MNCCFYLLSLLLCINLCICYECISDKESNNAPRGRKRDDGNVRRKIVEEMRHRKRRDYEMVYDKDPVEQIDVASFIKRPEDDSIDSPYEYQYKKMSHGKDYGDYGGLVELNSDDTADINENAYVESENPLPLNPENVYPTSVSYDKISNEKFTQGYDNILKVNADSDSKNSRHNPQKKCALKNIKLPFFSHNKSESIKGKKEKKRKLYGFNKPTKEKAISKPIDENSPKLKLTRRTESPYKYYKINKRSYVEMLCPACKRKFISNKRMEMWEDKRRDVLNRKHSTFNTRHTEIQNGIENNRETDYIYDDDNPVNDEDSEDSMSRRRKREDDNRNIERQKELDDLERRVDSVTISSTTYTKNDPKV